jgi:ornithine cyclodeaminase/alanine dehydrogenase-like protein (mu-crystallin family)
VPDVSAALPPLRYLSADDVEACMPPIDERLELAERTMRALVADAEMPPKIAVHPRPTGSFAHAMPAYLRGSEASVGGVAPRGAGDGLGIKWVTGFPANGEVGLPSIAALVVLNDPATGLATAILDGGPITAQRTAAVSGVAIRAFAPTVAGRPTRVALIGAGAQARSHLPVLGRVLAGLTLSIYDSQPERAAEVAALAATTPGIAGAAVAASARFAADGADVVVTVAAFGPVRQVMTPDWVGPETLVVAVDYATYVSARLASDAALFLVDDRPQFLANRDAGNFDDYPDPGATLGEALIAGTPRPSGQVVVSHLGVGLADVIFGNAILAAAERAARGTLLPR